jgi:hypothetical protein
MNVIRCLSHCQTGAAEANQRCWSRDDAYDSRRLTASGFRLTAYCPDEDDIRIVEGTPKAKASHEQESLQRQIAATDRQIDTLVYALYGLTEDRTRIVEGRKK